jgi:O-antigen ligase
MSSSMATSTLHLEDWKLAIVLGILASATSVGLFVRTWYLLPITFLTLGAVGSVLFGSVRFPYLLFLIFVLIAWFPEFSQTDLSAWTAEDAPSLYNLRPIPGITASVFDYLFSAIVLVWLLKYVLPDPRKLLKAPLAGPMLAFFAVWVVNLSYGLYRGNETYQALREFRVGAYFVLTYLMVVTACGELEETRKFIKLSVVMAALVGIYGVFRYVLGIGVEFADVRLIYYDIADSMLLYIAMILIASFAIEGTITKGKAFLTTALVFPMAFSFLFSYRRGAWVALTAGLVFLVVFYPRRARLRHQIFRRVLFPAVAIMALIAAVPSLRSNGLDFVVTRINSIFDVTEDPSNVFRVLDAMNALNSFTQHPILGVGAGGRYELEFASENPVMMKFMEHVSNASHNGYLYVLFKAGIIGFLIYLAIFANFLRRWFDTRKVIARPLERAVFMALGAIVIALLVNNVTEPVSDTLRPSLLLAFVMSWGAIWMQELDGRARRISEGPVGQVSSQQA